MDFKGHREDTKVAELFHRLGERTDAVKILGSYAVDN